MDINEALALAKEVNKKMLGIGYAKQKDFCPHDLYEKTTDMAEHISYHAVKDVFPEKLFLNRSPNQTEIEFKYIKDNYKQFTLPVFVDLLSTTGRIFADNNWHIDYRGNDDFKKYVEEEIPKYTSIENYIKFILLQNKLIDANSFVAVRPKEIPTVEQEVEGEIKLVIDPSKKFEPYPVYFPSKNVVKYDEGDYYFFLSYEKSVVTFEGKEQEAGTVFELYTDKAVWFIRQTGKKIDNIFEAVLYFEYDSIPVTQLKGIPTLHKEEVLWQSPFIYAVDLLDCVLTNENWLQASINKCVYPHVVMYGSSCEFKDADNHTCSDGYLYIDDKQKICPSCKGSGLKSRLSPVGTLLLNPKTRTSEGDSALNQAPLQFISPSVDTLKFIRDKCDNDEARARKILHLQTSNSQVNGSENLTATGIVLDSKTMFSFIKPISDQIFETYEFILDRICEQRLGTEVEKPALTYPKTFDFKTPEDYLAEISDAIKNNLPPSFVEYVLMKYIDSIYGDNEKTIKIFQLITEADRLFGLSQDEINMKLAKGTVAKWEDILHTSAVYFINTLMNDKGFLEKEMSVKVKAIQDLAIAKEKELNDALTARLAAEVAIPIA